MVSSSTDQFLTFEIFHMFQDFSNIVSIEKVEGQGDPLSILDLNKMPVGQLDKNIFKIIDQNKFV